MIGKDETMDKKDVLDISIDLIFQLKHFEGKVIITSDKIIEDCLAEE